MCHFLSAILARSGEIYCNPLTDSHSDLIALHNLREGKAAQNFIRVEFTPPSGDKIDQPDLYTLRVDETFTPAWFDDERRAALVEYLKGVISRMIVRDERPILLGGAWIVAAGAKVEAAQECRIVAVLEGGTITTVRGGTITTVEGGTITNVWGGTITNVEGGTITTVEGGTITTVRGGTITTVEGGTITNVEGGTITTVWGGTITTVRGGTITTVRGGTITTVEGGTITGEISNYATVPDSVRPKLTPKRLRKKPAKKATAKKRKP